jgi:ABC-type nickel/cobalt efflux system permease component RcnA
VLLLSSIALGRVGLGLILLVSFSLGLASVLVAIGMVVLFAKNLLPAGVASGDNRFFRWVPVLSACVIVVIGLVLTGVSLGLVKSAI